MRNIENDFAALIVPGLNLAFKDRQKITLKGHTILGEQTQRDIWVCGPAAFIVLKALAFDLRGENKDAYDLYYVIRNYGTGVGDIEKCFEPVIKEPDTIKALTILKRDFTQPDNPGPMRVAQFLNEGPDEDIQADVVGFVRELLNKCGQT